MVRLEGMNLCPVSGDSLNFNSSMVRLEEILSDGRTRTNIYFNSSMVRLEAAKIVKKISRFTGDI